MPKKHNLEENLNPIGKYAGEEIFESGGCETLMLLGKDLLHLHPTMVDKYEAEGSHDNISNWVMLLQNMMYPEMILVGQRLEVPTHISLKAREENFNSCGERLSPSERRILEGRPPRPTDPRSGTSQNRLKIHEEVLNSPKGTLNPYDRLEICLMMEEKYSPHNLDPNCKSCTQCQTCYFPN